ncbi:glycosyltransferase family 2 protein [Brevundimonas sp.]|jgi:glycosyltransferase involved in cell wall biosynthesis|uniref:glycosyltransferase family 2 protein n=1 Tax=Brevundimonas sp. TaxID=1871086 RepID=UPI002E1410CC|nr:glycosyltransferase family 2 protein [Brevundimonas sp.]
MAQVAVVIPTLRRPESLTRALRSVFAQKGVEGHAVEIVVVDNDPAGTATAPVEALKPVSPFPLHYATAPHPGVATARNAGLAATDAPLIAFLDDDQEAGPGWLAALLAAQARTGADVVFGPITGVAEGAPAWARAHLDAFFGREGPQEDRLIDKPWGCGNALLVRATALPGPAPFDVAADQQGGEDDVLFARVKASGGRFGWAANARVSEIAPPHRATMAYALRRAFAYGQGPSQEARARGDWPGVIRWMAVGVVQTVVWSTASAGLWLLRRPARARAMDRAARGLGKVLWAPMFEPRFYGAQELARLERLSPSGA